MPAQLKQYFITSMRGKSYIDEAMLDEIEELYIYIILLYTISMKQNLVLILSPLLNEAQNIVPITII